MSYRRFQSAILEGQGFDAAQSFCQDLGADTPSKLAVPPDQKAMDFAFTSSAQESAELVYLGGKRVRTVDSGAWQWRGGPSGGGVGRVNMTYINWKPGQPNDGVREEACLTFAGDSGKWYDVDCGSRMDFLCQVGSFYRCTVCFKLSSRTSPPPPTVVILL